ncbi:DUF4091 domain-containing protein [Myxococcaceae bacterium GXIMD 01537]
MARALVRWLMVVAMALGPAALAQEAGPTAWGESAMRKVRPNTPAAVQPRLELRAARNEFVSFQVGLHGGASGWRNVSAVLARLDGPIRIEGPHITVYRETYLQLSKPSAPGFETGLWPDGLVPEFDETVGQERRAFPLDVPPGESRALWVDIHVPQDAPPGDYQGTVEVTGDGVTQRIELHLRVVPMDMPSTASLRSSFALWMPNVCLAFTGKGECPPEKQLELAQAFFRLALEHRVTLAIHPELPFYSGPDVFDTFWVPWLSGTVPSRLPGVQLTSLRLEEPLSVDGISSMGNRLSAGGWLTSAYVFAGDEPPWHSTPEGVRDNALLARQATPQVRTLITSEIDYLGVHGLTDLIDIVVVMVNFIDGDDSRPPYQGPQRAKYTEFLARPNTELWLYQGCLSHGCIPVTGPTPPEIARSRWPSYMVDDPAGRARAMEWVSFLEGATGEFYYETGLMLTSAWTDQFAYGGNGDGTLFYPGTPSEIGGATGVPLPSIRLKHIRLGMQDYEWLKAVSDAGDPAFARAVARTLMPTAWQVPEDSAAFDQARDQLIQRYLELIGEP